MTSVSQAAVPRVRRSTAATAASTVAVQWAGALVYLRSVRRGASAAGASWRPDAARIRALAVVGRTLACFGPGENARQMRPHSDFLRALAHTESGPGPGLPFTSIYSKHHETTVVRAETDDGIVGWGEAQSPVSPRTTRTIVEELVRPRARLV
mgnify:CR=1 FL=1